MWVNDVLELTSEGAWIASDGYTSLGFGAHSVGEGSEAWLGQFHEGSVHRCTPRATKSSSVRRRGLISFDP